MKQTLTILLLLVMAVGKGQNSAKIKQEVSVSSLIKGSYFVSTYVYIYDSKGKNISLEYWEQVKVSKRQIDSTLKVEYNKAIPMYKLAKQIKN